MFETILIPTDGSGHAESAAETGFELAAVHGADVHVLSVADIGPLSDVQLPGERDDPRDAIRGVAEDAVETLRERAETRDLDVTGAVRTGPTKTEILAYAADIDADLIVMGTRGRGGVKRLALGSVTDYVIRNSDVEVLVSARED